MQAKKIYIAGKITGEDYQKAFNKFKATEEMLTGLDFQPINPMMIVPKGTPWQDAMDILKPHLINSDIVLFLPDWKQSEGATQERLWAAYYGKTIVEYANIYGELLQNSHASAD